MRINYPQPRPASKPTERYISLYQQLVESDRLDFFAKRVGCAKRSLRVYRYQPDLAGLERAKRITREAKHWQLIPPETLTGDLFPRFLPADPQRPEILA